MIITPKDLAYIRQGLTKLMVSKKVQKERKQIKAIELLLERLDQMEREFYNNAPQ